MGEVNRREALGTALAAVSAVAIGCSNDAENEETSVPNYAPRAKVLRVANLEVFPNGTIGCEGEQVFLRESTKNYLNGNMTLNYLDQNETLQHAVFRPATITAEGPRLAEIYLGPEEQTFPADGKYKLAITEGLIVRGEPVRRFMLESWADELRGPADRSIAYIESLQQQGAIKTMIFSGGFIARSEDEQNHMRYVLTDSRVIDLTHPSCINLEKSVRNEVAGLARMLRT